MEAIPSAALMGVDLWSPIATSCNPTPGIGRNFPSSRDAGGEKYSMQHVSKAGRAARIGAIIRKWPAFPAKADHGAPFLHYGVLLGYEHVTFSISNDDVHQRECRPAFLPMRFVTPDKPPPKPVFRHESFTGLERSN
jgi:hypothetical protein